MELTLLVQQLEQQGYAWLRSFISVDECQRLKTQLLQLPIEPGRGGIRHIDRLSVPVAQLIQQGDLARLANNMLGQGCSLVRAIWFNKTVEQNWLVAWHQDKTVCAQQRFDETGWAPWSYKEGVWHVQPPLGVLQSMLTVRLHLDVANHNNGALRVVPGSHRDGIVYEPLPVDDSKSVVCEAAIGDVLLMSPLLWHASSKATQASSRQILHVEYAHHPAAAKLGWQMVHD